MSPAQGDQAIHYELPRLVESLRQGWITSFQAMAVVGALFAAGETTLIPFVKTTVLNGDGTPKLPAHPGLFKLLLAVSYGAFFFSASVTISSVILIDELSLLSFLNRAKGSNNPALDFDSVFLLLKEFQLTTTWYWVGAYCWVSIFLGCLCIVIQLAVYTWLNESRAVTILTAAWFLMPVTLQLYKPLRYRLNVREIRP